MFIIIFVPMNKVKLLVHRREVSIEQQQVVQARVIWYVPCMSHFKIFFQTPQEFDKNDIICCCPMKDPKLLARNKCPILQSKTSEKTQKF